MLRKTLGAWQLADHTETVENRHLQIQAHNIGGISVKGFTFVCDPTIRNSEASRSRKSLAGRMVVKDENRHFCPLSPYSFPVCHSLR